MYNTIIFPKDLVAHIEDPDWVVFDCRFTLTDTEAGRKDYAQSHIPGAVYVHLDEDLSSPITQMSGRHPLPDPVVLSEKLSAWGVGNNTQIVVYDDAFGSVAGRLWWLLRWLGHTKVALLDGGLPVWLREGYAVTDKVADVVPSTFEANINTGLIVSSEDVESMMNNENYLIIDARAEMRFEGITEPFDKVAGHIPGAINVPYDDNLAVSGGFETRDELHDVYKERAGNLKNENIIHMCGSGVTACHNILAMEYAGLSGSRLYVGSWSEWITNPARPVATGE